MFKDFNAFVDWAAGRILCDLMKEGGPGLRSAVYAIINAYVNWQAEQKKLEDRQWGKMQSRGIVPPGVKRGKARKAKR